MHDDASQFNADDDIFDIDYGLPWLDLQATETKWSLAAVSFKS